MLKPGANATDTFSLSDGVAIYGGVSGAETFRAEHDWETYVTVLSGDIDGNDGVDPNGVISDTARINGTNAIHVVTSDGVAATTPVLDGFAITGGFQPPGDWASGAGLYNDGSPTLTNILFSGNHAYEFGFGGGMYNKGSPTLTGITFTGNWAYNGGGLTQCRW